jgi:hypothetical protein
MVDRNLHRRDRMGAAAAIIARRQRDVVSAYQTAGATSPAAARTPGELGVEHDMIVRGLVNRAVLRDAGEGRYYLDVPSWEALRRTRGRLVLVVGGIAVLLAVLLALGVIRLR